MPFLNFGGNKNKHFNLSNMNFYMKNMKNRYSDPDPHRLLQCCTAHKFTCSIFLLSIHVRSLFRWSNLYTMTATAVGLGFLNVDPDPRIHLSVIVDPDPDRRQNEMDPKR